MQMDDIQSWWEVPSIAHFCSLFRAAFNLLDFDIEELEEALLTDGTEDSGSSLLQELIVRLLCGCLGNHDISTFNYQMFLRRLFRQKCQEYGRDNPFNTDMDFQFLPLRTKVEILHALCDFRLDADDVQDLLKNLESDSLRVEPLGHDENNSAYWYFYGTRLYREDYPKTKKKTKEKRRKGKDEKKRKKHGRSDLDGEEKGTGVWQVVCFTEQDWDRITEGFKDSRSKAEKELYHTLAEDFLPEIPRLFAEKERLQRKRLLEYQPRRQSSRLEKLKQQKEEEESLQKTMEKEEKEQQSRRKLEQEKKEKGRHSRNVKERASRVLVRSQSRTTSECGSTGSFVESVIENKPTQSTTFVGRQTNNSLSSATGQIVIQGLRRKLRSSQVFRQTEEDLQTGMYKILEFIKNHEDAWPFLEPVDEQYAPRYYSIINMPMDLQQMEDKLDDGEYMSFSDFKSDFQLIVDNCRKYNGTDNEYTEMVGNLQEAFQLAVDRYLESEPSSDEEVAVEFIEKAPEKVPTARNNSKKKKKKEVMQQHEEEEEEKIPSLPPSMPPSPSGSDGSDKIADAEKESEDKSDEPIEAPDSDESSTKDDGESKSCANNNNNGSNDNINNTKRKKKSNGGKNGPDIEALELATEQTLKDINKWLDDTPRYSEFSSASNSPSHFVSAEEYEVGSRVENEYRRNIKVEKPSRSKDSKDNSKKRPSKDSTKQMRRREVQRTIERLQPGKSKGNLISNIQNVGKVSEEGPPGKPKDTRSCLFPVVDETTPKLSLGTVLGTDVLGFGVGQNKHNFDAENKEVQSVSVIEETPKTVIDVRPRTPEFPLENENMEEYTEKKEKDEMEIKSINKDNRQEKVMPNLSAWFKAFGAPKPTSGTKKRVESLQDGSSVEIISEERKNVSNIITVDLTVDKNISVKTHSVIVHDIPRQPVVVNPRFEETDSQCSLQQKSNEDEMPSLLPIATVHQGTPRQRKVSTGSNISERSSFSQDLMDTADGSSPHLSLDERLSNYPASYPSPCHQSPVAAAAAAAAAVASVITSPVPEEGPKFASYPPLNGTIRVGFYQDTSFSQQKSSPEKNINSSHSPKDRIHNSYLTYNSRMYPSHDPDDFLPYQNQRAGSPPATVESYENSYVSPLMTYYDTSKPLTDQYRAARTQETEVFSPNSTTEEISAPLPTTCSSPQHSVEVSSSVSSSSHASVVVSAVVQKPSITVFPVKKRLYSEMESNGSVQSGRYHVSPPPAHSLGTPPPAHSQSASRILPPESLIVIDNALHSRPICTFLEDSDKIVASSSEKLYNSKMSPICEPSLKKAEHVSKKHQSIRTLQSTAHIAFGGVERLQQSSPETITEYPEKSSHPHRFSPSLKHAATQPIQYVSRSNSVKKHVSVVPENSASYNEESPHSTRIQHSNVPVITTHVSNPSSHQEYNSKSERPIVIERSLKTASTLDNMQPVTGSSRETTRSSRLHTNSTCSSPPSVHDRLKSNTSATLHGGDMSYHRGPFSPVPPSPLGMEHLALHGNLSNLTHVVDRFPPSERLLSGLAPSTPPYYNEKNLPSQHVFRQTVSSTLPTSISPSTAMALLSQPSPAVMTITYNHESQMSPSSMPFNRSVPELPSVLPNKVSNMQASYSRSVQDLSGMLPTKDTTPITAPTSFNRSVPDLQVIHTDKVSSTVNSSADYRSVTDLSSVISTKVTTPVDLKTYNQSVTDLSTVLPNKVSVPSSIGVPSSFTRSAAADYSLLSGKASESQLTSKPTRKRKSKQTPVSSSDVPIATTTTSSTAFQQYVGLNSSPNVSEPSAIALKTATVLTGSAFNFGSAHSGLGLYSTEKDGYPAYLEDYRTASSSYYIPAPDPNHDKINPASHPSAPTPSLPFPFTSHPRPPSYALAQAFINQSGLVDPTSTAPPLYQQYLHRHPEELLRHSGTSMVLHQGLLPPASYPPGYHPALGIRQTYDTLNRPTWL